MNRRDRFDTRGEPGRGRRIVALALCGAAVFGAVVVAGEVRQELTREIEIETSRAARAAEARGGEVVRLHWKLGGFLGLLAGLFVPSSGDGVLTFVPSADDKLDIELLITAPNREREYFLYGAVIDQATRSTSQVWSSYAYRDSQKDREQVIDEPDVIDFASVIYHLRWHAPTETSRMRIWSSGKTYPVEVRPLGLDRRKIAGRKIDVRGYLVRGVKVDGGDSFDDKFWLYFATDDDAAPVEIVGRRSLVRLRIQMQGHSGRVARAPVHAGATEARASETKPAPTP